MQLPALGWVVGAVLSGPIAHQDAAGTLLGALGFLALALITELNFHFRVRLALELGEAMVHDLRNRVYEHLLRMPISYFQARTGRVGRLISRTISDVDAIRVGVQDVVFAGVVQLGTMIGAAALMIYHDGLLFLVVLALVPLLWRLIAHFRRRLESAHRAVHESFSKVTSTLAESVTGVKVTQGYVREDINGGLFRQLIDLHSRNNMEVVRHSSVFLPMLEFNGQVFIAILLAVGGRPGPGRRRRDRGAGAVPLPVQPVLQPHPGAGHPLQPGADRDGRGRAGVQAAGHAARLDRRPRRPAAAAARGPGRAPAGHLRLRRRPRPPCAR